MSMINKKRKKVLLFYNPYSGNGMFKDNLDKIIFKFQNEKLQVVPVRASKDFSIADAVAEMNADEYRQIVVAGGDGTINICVNAMVKSGLDLPLAIFPMGTANDLAYYFDLPQDIDALIDIALGDNLTYADVGVCNDRYFINVAAIGNLVDVSQKTDPSLKNNLGIISYYLKGITEVVNLKPLKVKITTPNEVFDESMYFMIVMNGQSAGGFKNLSPLSEIDDGLLDVILFREMPFLDIAPLFFKVIRGVHTENKNILNFRTNELLVESDEDISTDVDGESGEKLPLKFSILNKRLRIFTNKV